MKRTPLIRKKAESKNSKGLFDHIPKDNKNLFSHLSKPSKNEEWAAIREELKTRFAKVGILSCELDYECCVRSYNFGHKWSFAHSLKREQIASAKYDPELREEQLKTVVYACQNCHSVIESRGNKKLSDDSPTMEEIVEATIAKRERQP